MTLATVEATRVENCVYWQRISHLAALLHSWLSARRFKHTASVLDLAKAYKATARCVSLPQNFSIAKAISDQKFILLLNKKSNRLAQI